MKKINITPLGDRVIIKQQVAETTTASGIIIPESSQQKPLKGLVISCGKGTKNNPMTVKEGDNILYSRVGGNGYEEIPTQLEYEGEDYLIMRESDIVAIVEDERGKVLEGAFPEGGETWEILKWHSDRMKSLKSGAPANEYEQKLMLDAVNSLPSFPLDKSDNKGIKE